MATVADIGLGEAGARLSTATYGFAHYGKSLFWYASELLFAFLSTEVVGLAPSSMALVLACGFMVGAVLDLTIGLHLSRLSTPGHAVLYQAGGAVVSAMALMATCALYWLPHGLQFALALLFGVVFRLAYAFYDIPQNALLGMATRSSEGRTNLSGLRYVFSGLASLTVAFLAAPILGASSTEERAVRFCMAGGVLSATAVSSAMLLAYALRRRSTPALIEPGSTGRAIPGEVWSLLGLMFIISFGAPVFTKLEPYFATFVIKGPWLGGAVVVAFSLGMVVAQPFWIVLCRRVRRWTSLVIASLALAGAGAVFAVVDFRGASITLATMFVCGAASGGVGMTLWASFGDAVARSSTAQALPFALFTASSKISLAMSALLIGELLSETNYRNNEIYIVLAMAACLTVAGLSATLFLYSRPSRRFADEIV